MALNTLPNAEHAMVQLSKLRDYVLNPQHPEGRHKARVFRSALGLIVDDAEELQRALLQAARLHEALPAGNDQFGSRYRVDFEMVRQSRSARIRSLWIVTPDNIPRLTSCYVL